MISSVILSGRSNKELHGKYNKGLIEIHNKPMISYVIDALKDSGVVDKIVIIGNPEDFRHIDRSKVDKIINDKGSIMDNILSGVEYLHDEARVLITTCDIPLLIPEAVKDFVEKSLSSGADVCYPIVDKTISERKYPEAKRTYAKLKEGSFTGGNLFIINPKVVQRSVAVAKQMIEHRKNPVKMSRVLGFRFLLRFLAGRLTIEGAEKRVADILALNPKAIVSTYPEVGNDVDKPVDVEMVRKYLQAK